MLRIGLTGGIGSGKSSVATLLAERGAAIVDADEIAREVVVPGGPAYGPLVDRFGDAILAADGTIDRAALAAAAFADPGALSDLNAITHPVIGLAMARRLEELDAAGDANAAAAMEATDTAGTAVAPERDVRAGNRGVGIARIAVVVIPLLREHHRAALRLGAVVVVDCPVEVAVARLVQRRGMEESDARARIDAQVGRAERLALADYVVDNSGSPVQLAREVDALWAWLQGRRGAA